ncbi:hypothetical protein D3C75_1218630 [compost metagenome]
MDRVGAGGLQRTKQGLDIEVAFVGAGRAEDVHFVGHARSLGLDVCFAARRHGGNSQRLRGADDPHGDLATVGDQQFTNALSHGRALTLRRVWR